MKRQFVWLLVFFAIGTLTACSSSPKIIMTESPQQNEAVFTNQIMALTIQATQTTTPIPAPENQLSEEIEYILLTMLNSHKLWDSVKGTAELNWFYESGNPKDTYSVDFFIKQPDTAYIDTRSKVGLGLPNLFITSGETRYVVVQELDGYYQSEQHDITNQIASLPTNLDEVANVGLDAWKEGHHPFASGIFSPIESFLYPQWFAYRNPENTYTLFGKQIYLERNAWVVGYTNDKETYLAWIDEETGLILKFLRETISRLDMQITSIEFNVNQGDANLGFLDELEKIGEQVPAPYVCFNEPICSWGPSGE